MSWAEEGITTWWSGERIDEETGESHLAHAACCLWFERKEGSDG